MFRICLLLCLSSTSVLAEEATRAITEQEIDSLWGKWVAIYGERDGDQLSKGVVAKMYIHFSDKAISGRSCGFLGINMRFRLDPTTTPKRLEHHVAQTGLRIAHLDFTRPYYAKNIYSLKNGVLKICFGHDDYPEEFKTKKGDRLLLVHYKMKQSEKEEKEQKQ